MLQVQKNSRQIPSSKVYTADKEYNDLLYGYLQEISYPETINGKTNRYISKKQKNFSEISSALGGKMSRQTVSKRFAYLLDIGLLEYEEKYERYKLNLLDKNVSTLVPFETLRCINNALSVHAISIYVHLLNRYIAEQEKEFMINLTELISFIGLSPFANKNRMAVGDILKVLSLIGLIEKRTVFDAEKNKTHIFISKVYNVLKKDKDVEIMSC